MKLGLLGFPVKHSLSPWIHGQFLDKSGREGTYQLFETRPEELSARVKNWRAENIDGFNITIPYKQKIIPYLDKIDKEAENIGAVNTVANQNGIWTGYNTDGRGYYRSLTHSFPAVQPGTSTVLIIGAGGGARGIYHVLVSEGFARVDLTNRTEEKAVELLHSNKSNTPSAVLTLGQAEERLGEYDIIIQTTSVGMEPSEDQIPLSVKNIKPEAIASDIVYKPLNTRFLQEAAERGANIHHGHAMLLYQAQYAYEIWTGDKVPLDSILEQLEYRLRGN